MLQPLQLCHCRRDLRTITPLILFQKPGTEHNRCRQELLTPTPQFQNFFQRTKLPIPFLKSPKDPSDLFFLETPSNDRWSQTKHYKLFRVCPQSKTNTSYPSSFSLLNKISQRCSHMWTAAAAAVVIRQKRKYYPRNRVSSTRAPSRGPTVMKLHLRSWVRIDN